MNLLSDLKENLIIKIKCNKVIIIIFLLMFVVGAGAGALIEKTTTVNVYFISYSENYYYKVFAESQSTVGIFFSRIFNNLLFFAAIIFLSLSVFLFPVHFVLIFYRGFILGSICVIIFKSYSINGVILALLVIIPQHLITTLFLVLAQLTCMEQARQFRRQGGYYGFKAFLVGILILYILSFIGALIEFLIIALLLRPLNFLF